MQAITDHRDSLSDKTNEQSLAAKQRFESFKLGAAFSSPTASPPVMSMPSHGRSHSRSHSRNISITSISSVSNLPPSNSALGNGGKFTNDLLPSPKQRPNSHHRRRSSVSTRRESAELMGLSVPDLPASKSDDNVNLGDKDSIRRRALWALEGKPDVSYSKVEIPELVSPEIETFGFNFPTKPSYPAGTGAGYNGGLNALAGKRDSIGKYISSGSSKDQLHTLVEEEEEEEDGNAKGEEVQAIEAPSNSMVPCPITPVSFTVAVTKPSPARHRPASLNLRPLALTSGSIINPVCGGLPTPTLTPASKSSGLKSLSLSASPCVTNNNFDTTISTNGMKRQSLILASSPTNASGVANRRMSLNITCDKVSPAEGAKRQSSISYKSSADPTLGRFAGLPTPEMTPIQTERRQLDCPIGDELSPSRRPLSASEQHFLFKSHNALLARITDLETALSARSRSRSWSRPVSVASDVSSNASEPSDEMLSLITDLKAERDELKRDVDGWRTRVADLEDRVGVLAKRVEAERREAWVARSHLGLLNVEKNGIEKALRDKTVCFQEALGKLDAITEERNDLKAENKELREQVKRAQDVKEECDRLKLALEEERQKREDIEKALQNVDILSTPTPGVPSVRTRRLFKSMDSEASLTDVEPCDDIFAKITPLKAVVEEEEDAYVGDDSYESDEDNGLAGYEDEEDFDLSFESPDGSSVGSMDEYARASLRLSTPSTPSLVVSDTSAESASPGAVTPSAIKHAVHNSLSRTWTFPVGPQSKPSAHNEFEEIDRFFGCLDDLDSSPPSDFMAREVNSKSLFSQSLGSCSDIGSDDELPPFVLPSHVGVEVDTSSRTLDVVLEEEEEEEEEPDAEDVNEEFEGEEFEGGIRFIFNTPSTPVISVTPPTEPLLNQAPLAQASQVFVPFDDEEDEAEVPFTFSKFQIKTSNAASAPSDDSDLDCSVLARNVSPSSIPRSTALKSFTSTLASTPTRANSKRFTPPPGQSPSAFMTPPSKRGGKMPSFIPQPIASPPKTLMSAKPNAAPSTTFMCQPLHKPTTIPSRRVNANDAINAPFRSQSIPMAQRGSPDSQMMVAVQSDRIPPTSAHGHLEQPATPAASFSSIVSLQALTNWWTPRSSTTAMTSCMIPENLGPSSNFVAEIPSMKPKGPVERKYVSKDKQLMKLRIRLERERRADCDRFQMNMCRTCVAGEVCL